MNTRIAPLSLSAFALLAASAFAQQPAAGVANVEAAAAQIAAPNAGAPGGGGRGGGRGGLGPGTTLAGGPQANDPAYANFDWSPRAPVVPQTPQEELKHIILKPGYKLDLVLSDPVIAEPTAVAFDGNGRMYVLEDRGYMQTADADGEHDPVARISRHEDLNNDGVYEKHTVFVDNLIFPRFVTPFGKNAILTMESDHDEVWKYTDTNNDGVADKKELWSTGFGRSANVEHQQSFLTWTLDNWMYSTVNSFRARWTPNGIIKEPTGSNGAQWGVSQDNDGKQWFEGGASGVPSYFQFPIVYGTFSAPDQMSQDLRTPWGAPVRIADMQGGMSLVRMPDGSLNGTTAGAGSDIVRADRMPKDLQGDYLYGEEVARILRRVRPTVTEGVTKIANFYEYDEFIKSTDPLFRPVDSVNAPDGTIYIVDMYRGIIQEAQWSGRGTYLRNRIDQYALDKVHSHGRIWRLSYEGTATEKGIPRDATMPHMLDQTPAQLVQYLGHPNGWWRDSAQQLIVLSQDKSVAPALTKLVQSQENLLGRFHALWALEGLGELKAPLVRQEMKDANPRMRVQAIRASETLYKAGDKSFAADYATLAKDADANVAVQALLTINLLQTPDAKTVAKAVQTSNKGQGVQMVTAVILNPPDLTGGRGGRGGPPAFTAEEQAVYNRGRTTFNELCFNCHGTDGRGTPKAGADPGITMAPSLSGSPRVIGHRDYAINVVLHGLNGPLAGTTYVEQMIPMGTQSDQWIADVLSFVRNSFGNTATFITAADVKAARTASASRTSPWTFAELDARLPRQVATQDWKVTASHNNATANNALSFASWNTGAPQQNGMWFQVELPAAVPLTEIQFTAGAAGGGGGGGRGGGRGGIPASTPEQTAALNALTTNTAPQNTAVNNARTALVQTSLTDRASNAAKVGDLANLELALAMARADAFAKLQASPEKLGAGQVQALVAQVAPAPAQGAAPAAGGTGYPRGYRVEVSSTGINWTPVAQGQGNDGLNTIAFAAAPAKFVRITQTASGALPNWSMTNLRLYQSGSDSR